VVRSWCPRPLLAPRCFFCEVFRPHDSSIGMVSGMCQDVRSEVLIPKDQLAEESSDAMACRFQSGPR
jgi:hypothetical protein